MLSFKQLMERVNETRSFYLEEEVEGLDEDYKDQHPGYNEKHAAHSKAKSLHSSGHLKPEYHKDGSATIHVKPYDDTSSTRLTDRIHDDAGLNYNHPTKKIAKGITQVHHGLKYSTRSDDGGKTHSVHISSTTEKNMRDGSAREVKEEVEGLDELSRETVRTYYNKSIAQGKPIADKMKMGGGDHSSDGSDTKTLKKRAAGVTMALKRRRGEVKMSEEFDLDESRMEDLAMDMESLSHEAFKRKHRRTKQQMQDALKSEGVSFDGSYDKNSNAHKEAKKLATGGGTRAEYHTDGSATIHVKPPRDAGYSSVTRADHVHKDAGLWHNHSAKELKNKAYIHKGLKYHTKEHDGGNSHTIHISHTSESDEGGEGYGREVKEELKGNQHKIDANKNGKVDGHDFKILRNAKKARYQ